MAVHTYWSKDDRVVTAARQIAAAHGLSMSQLLDNMLTMFVRSFGELPEPLPGSPLDSAMDRARATFAELGEGTCDKCAADGLPIVTFDLTTGAMSISRFCELHKAENTNADV
jgi:hypothetical protein